MRKTEEFAEAFRDIETRSDEDIAAAILDAQSNGLAAVRKSVPNLTAAARAAATRLRDNPTGRLI